jgi:HK97 family phage prohead protease
MIGVDFLTIEARAMPESVNVEDRTVGVVFATASARVLRMSVDGPFFEELDLSPGAVDLSRLNAGAPLLNGHRGGEDATKIVGTVVPGSVRVDGSQGFAVVRFDDGDNDPTAGVIFGKVRNGIISGVSVGYRIHKMQRQKESVDGIPVYRVTKWEPHEISVAPIPADVGAKFRSLGAHEEKETMSDQQNTEAAPAVETRAAPVAPVVDVEGIRAAERQRITEIESIARSVQLDSMARSLVESGATIEDARKQILDAVIARDSERSKPRGVSVEVVRDARDSAKEGLRDALEYRAGLRSDATEQAKPYLGRSLLEMGSEYIRAVEGKPLAGSRMQQAGALLVRSGMHSTSDFPLLLADVAGKALRSAYSEAPQTFEPLSRRVTIPDFKSRKVTQIGDAPVLEAVPEGAEIKLGTIGEGREVYSLATYAKRLAITRQTLINDDMDAFSRMPAAFGRSARDTESNIVWSHYLSNPTMGDGVVLFHASHGNLGSGVINVANIGAGRAAMRKQTGLNGSYLNVAPAYILVPAALETTADQFVSSALLASQSSSVNPFASRLMVIAEPRLDVGSATAWYLVANPSGIDTIEIATLEGENGPYIETREGFEIDGFEIKCRHDFAAKVIDHRGFYKSTGV